MCKTLFKLGFKFWKYLYFDQKPYPFFTLVLIFSREIPSFSWSKFSDYGIYLGTSRQFCSQYQFTEELLDKSAASLLVVKEQQTLKSVLLSSLLLLTHHPN